MLPASVRWLPALLALGLLGCAPKTPAELVQAGRLHDACQLADYEYPERSQDVRAALRAESGLRIELELLAEAQLAALIGAPLQERLRGLHYRFDPGQTAVVTDLAIEEIRLSGKRHVPVYLSEMLAVELLAEPDSQPSPDGLLGETLVLLLAFSLLPLCLAPGDGSCDPSKLKLPAYEEMAKRRAERLQALNADPTLRNAKEKLLQLFGEPSLPSHRTGPSDGYVLLVPRHRSAKAEEHVRFVARHTLRELDAQCSLIDRFTVEAADVAALFATKPRLADLPTREITIWPAEHESPSPWPDS